MMSASVLTILLIGHVVAAICFMINLLKRRFDPAAMAFWAVCIVFVPFLGVVAYALLSEDHIARRAERRLGGRSAPSRKARAASEQDPALTFIEPKWRSVAKVAESIALTPLILGNRVEVLDDTQSIFDHWKERLRGAQHHIHMLYFTFWSDETGREFRDLLVQKATEGVKCRVLLDSVGSASLTWDFWNPLLDVGGEVGFFLPVAHYRRRWSVHLRNHRKLIVVDGRAGFMGSQNIDDNSHGWNPEYGEWADVCLNLEGPCIGELQRVFIDDWAFATEKTIEGAEYYPANGVAGETPIQIVPTGPDQKERIIERILLEAFMQAEHQIMIATPYFVPSDIFLVGLMRARLRNVRVRIVLPTVTDMRVVLHAGRSYYQELLEEGIEICEFSEGMLHSKVVAIDESWAMTGSANMDLRSFRMNFEISGLIYDRKVVERLTDVLEEYCRRARKVTLRDVEATPLRTRLLEGAARLLSPQL